MIPWIAGLAAGIVALAYCCVAALYLMVVAADWVDDILAKRKRAKRIDEVPQ